MQHPFVPRTYKEAIFAADDPSRNPDRVTRGIRRVRYRQLERDIQQFATLVPVPSTPGGERSSGSTYSPSSTIGGLGRVDERQIEDENDDDGWGAPPSSSIRRGAPKRQDIPVNDSWGSAPLGQPNLSKSDVNRIAISSNRWGRSGPTQLPQYMPAASSLETPQRPNLPPCRPIPATPNLPARPDPTAGLDTPFRTPRQPWQERAETHTAKRVTDTGNRLIQSHLGLNPRLDDRNLPGPPSSVASARTNTSHFFIPAPTRIPESAPSSPVRLRRFLAPPIHQHEPTRSPSPRAYAGIPISRSPSPISRSPSQPTTRRLTFPIKPSPTLLLDKLFSRLSVPQVPLPPATPAITAAEPNPASPPPAPSRPVLPISEPPTPTPGPLAPPSILPSPKETQHGPSDSPSPSPSAPSHISASSPSLPQAVPAPKPQTIPIPNPKPAPTHPSLLIPSPAGPRPLHLDASPTEPTTPKAEMRDRAEFDGVLGRIRTARSQLLDAELGMSSPAVARERGDEGVRREGSTRPGAGGMRGAPAFHDVNAADVVEELKKENQEYQRAIDKLKSEVGGLLQDLSTRGNSTSSQEATLRRLTRSLKEKDDALAAAEKALLKAKTETPSRSRYRSATPSPTRAPIADFATIRRADELADKVVGLKAQVHDLQGTVQKHERALKEGSDRLKAAIAQATGASTHASQVAKEKNAVEQRAGILEQQLEQERRGRVAINAKLRELEAESFGGLRQEVGVLRNKLTSAQQELANANEKYRDMAKKKTDLENKVKDIRNQGDLVQEQNKQLSDQLKNQEHLLKLHDRLKEEKREVSRDAGRLRKERTFLREELAEARSQTRIFERQVDINKEVQAAVSCQRTEDVRKSHLPTLASEINSSHASLRCSRRTSPSATETNSESGTETLTARPYSRHSHSVPPTPVNPPAGHRADETAHIERRYKLQTPLHPDRSDTGSEAEVEVEEADATPARLPSPPPAPPATTSTGETSASLDPFGDPQDGLVDLQSRGSERTSKSKTPLAVPKEASIGFSTPVPAAVPEPVVDAPIVDPIQADGEGSGDAGGGFGEGNAKERQDTLRYVNDVFSDNPMISDLSATPTARALAKRRSYKEDLEYLFYDPFAEIDEEFGLSKDGPSAEDESGPRSKFDPDGDDIEITSDFGRTPMADRDREMEEEVDISDLGSEMGSEVNG